MWTGLEKGNLDNIQAGHKSNNPQTGWTKQC